MKDTITDSVYYSLRLTFGIVHAVILTLVSFALVLFFPAFTHFSFGLFGFIIAPLLSLGLTLFCNACIEYVSRSKITGTRILKTAWIPPLGVFCTSLVILPLEMMPSLGFTGPLSTLVITSIFLNFIVTTLLQIHAVKDIQTYDSSTSESPPPEGSSGPM